MSEVVIRVENLSKQYRLGEIGTGSMMHDINRWWHKVRGKEDPYSKIGEANDRTLATDSEYVWALRDINFDVKQGEVLGIIGRNGAGKSTLLKILSKTTAPTEGTVKIKGRIASLLEVGTGFHPELSGRENIFLNGAILGMRKDEIRRKFDEIVDFAGVERYIDTPVKRYSSGMYVRLAFAVAAHLEPEILILDEVLAVGDAEFQKKCLGKMKDVSEKDGRTVLFVSHNLQAITTLCNHAVLLNNGSLLGYDTTSQIVNLYLKQNEGRRGVFSDESLRDKSKIVRASIKTSNDNFTHINGQPFEIEIEIYLPQPLRNGAFAFQVLNNMEMPIVHCWIFNSDKPILNKSGANFLKCKIPKFRLYMGDYKFRLILAENSGSEILQIVENACSFKVEMFSMARDYQWYSDACTYLEENEWEAK